MLRQIRMIFTLGFGDDRDGFAKAPFRVGIISQRLMNQSGFAQRAGIEGMLGSESLRGDIQGFLKCHQGARKIPALSLRFTQPKQYAGIVERRTIWKLLIKLDGFPE